MSWKETILVAGAVSCLLPVVAAYLRHRPGLAWGLTSLAAVALAAADYRAARTREPVSV